MRGSVPVEKLATVHRRGHFQRVREGNRMETPVFEEFDPASDCECLGCVRRRQHGTETGATGAGATGAGADIPHSPFRGSTGRRVLLAPTGGSALGAICPQPPAEPAPAPARAAVPAGEDPEVLQGGAAPLHGGTAPRPDPGDTPSEVTRLPPVTRDEIIARARKWVAAEVPYGADSFWSDGYRQDCAGFVSMAWNLGRSEGTGGLAEIAEPISREHLQPGDILLLHDPADRRQGSHAVLFGGWTDSTHTAYMAYETIHPRTREQVTPYPYWNKNICCTPFRYRGATCLVEEGSQGVEGQVTGRPGAEAGSAATPGQGAAPEADRAAGRRSPDAARGPAAGSRPAPGSAPAAGPDPVGTRSAGDPRGSAGSRSPSGGRSRRSDRSPSGGRSPRDSQGPDDGRRPDGVRSPHGGRRSAPALLPYPGPRQFGPGADNVHVMRLGRMLVERGGARFYDSGPGSRWTDADRLATRAFQRAQGWTGSWANGMPGALTWTYLVEGRGRDIPPESLAGPPGRIVGPTVRPSSHGVPGYPGRGLFRPGAYNAHVTELGEQLVRRGFGQHYTSGPGPRWGEADRRNVEDFQRSQGWRGGAADGCPGPETWRRLFT